MIQGRNSGSGAGFSSPSPLLLGYVMLYGVTVAVLPQQRWTVPFASNVAFQTQLGENRKHYRKQKLQTKEVDGISKQLASTHETCFGIQGGESPLPNIRNCCKTFWWPGAQHSGWSAGLSSTFDLRETRHVQVLLAALMTFISCPFSSPVFSKSYVVYSSIMIGI